MSARLRQLNTHAAPNQYREDGRPVIGLIVDDCAGCGHERLLTEWDRLCQDCGAAA